MRVPILSILAAGLALVGCSAIPRPTGVVSLDVKDGQFADGPYVVKRADFYYLRYRVALEDSHLPLLRVLNARKTRDKAPRVSRQR